MGTILEKMQDDKEQTTQETGQATKKIYHVTGVQLVIPTDTGNIWGIEISFDCNSVEEFGEKLDEFERFIKRSKSSSGSGGKKTGIIK